MSVFLSSKADSGLLVRVIPMLNYMMEDTNTNVIKRVMTCVVQLYKLALMVFMIITLLHLSTGILLKHD